MPSFKIIYNPSVQRTNIYICMMCFKKSVFSPEYGWPGDVDCPAFEGSGARGGFSRLDDSPDALFYKDPRLVEHIDRDAVAALTEYHGQQLQKLSKKFQDDK